MPLTGSAAALMYARLGNTTANPSGTGLNRPMRLGASRLGYYNPITIVKVGGTLRQGNYDDFIWIVTERLWDEPDDATIELFGFTPSEGQELIIACGSIANGRIFRGQIVDVDREHGRLNDGRLVYRCRALDWSFLFDRRLVTQKWVGKDGAEIFTEIVTSYTSGFSTNGIQRALGELDSFEVTDEEPSSAATRLMRRLGGYWEIDDEKIVRAWTGSGGRTNPATVINAAGVQGNRALRRLRYARDLEKIKTRVIVNGRGARTLVPAAVGDIRLPIDDTTPYNTAGGTVKVDNELVTYTGVDEGGDGAVVGPGNAPTSAPAGAIAGGTGLTAGATYKYAVTFVTASGETIPGPELSFVAGTGKLADPTDVPTIADSGQAGGKLVDGGSYRWKYYFRLPGGGKTKASPASAAYIANTNHARTSFTAVAAGGASCPAVVSQVQSVRTVNGGATYYDADFAPDPVVCGSISSVLDNLFNDTDLVTQPQEPSVSTAELQGCALTAIPISASSSVTQRKLYRTVANGAQLKLLTTITNNTATTSHDNVADGSLGANAPTSDTSGLTATGQVNAGATTLPISDATPFQSAGGWATSGSQRIKYTGKSGSTLTGIPATGDGAITASIVYGQEVILPAELTGIPASGAGSITHTIAIGTEANIRITRNSTAAQAVIAALEGGDGIHEKALSDHTLTEESCENLADAELVVWDSVLQTIAGTTADPNAQPGREFTVNVSEWSLNIALRIQAATIRRVTGEPWPQRQFTATAQKRSLYDILRALREGKL